MASWWCAEISIHMRMCPTVYLNIEDRYLSPCQHNRVAQSGTSLHWLLLLQLCLVGDLIKGNHCSQRSLGCPRFQAWGDLDQHFTKECLESCVSSTVTSVASLESRYKLHSFGLVP